jgi:hypothetical protein
MACEYCWFDDHYEEENCINNCEKELENEMP